MPRPQRGLRPPLQGGPAAPWALALGEIAELRGTPLKKAPQVLALQDLARRRSVARRADLQELRGDSPALLRGLAPEGSELGSLPDRAPLCPAPLDVLRREATRGGGGIL